MTPRSQYRSALKAIEILMFKWKIYCTQSSIYNVPLAQHLFSFPRSAIKWLIPCLCFSLLIHLLVEIVPTDDVSLYISLSPLDILTFEPCAMCVHFGKINFFWKIETELKYFCRFVKIAHVRTALMIPIRHCHSESCVRSRVGYGRFLASR